MESKDLRIGNFVNLNRTNTCVEVKAVFSDGVNIQNQPPLDINKNMNVSINSVSPIPLTEEWLNKFSLMKKYLENPFEEGGYDLDEKGNRWYHWVDGGLFNLEIQTNGEIWFEVYSCYRHIQYVHELQNLYHALNGKELVFIDKNI